MEESAKRDVIYISKLSQSFLEKEKKYIELTIYNYSIILWMLNFWMFSSLSLFFIFFFLFSFHHSSYFSPLKEKSTVNKRDSWREEG